MQGNQRRYFKILIGSVAFCVLITACGVKEQNKTQRVNLRQIGVTEQSTVLSGDSLDSIDDQTNDGDDETVRDETASPSRPRAGGTGGGSPGTESPPKGGQPATPATPINLTDSVKIYEKTVYPLARKNCAGGCHDTIVAPVFASENLTLAHDTVLSSHKVDFAEVVKSRLILRMVPDQHRCPAQGCEVAAKEFEQAIAAWSKEVGDTVTLPNNQASLTTGVSDLSKSEATRMDSGLPPGVLLFEAEAGVLKAPMVVLPVAGANGANVVHTPAGAGNQANLATAETQATLGGITFDFDVIEAGTYQLIGRINAPANANSSFYIKMDASPLVLWDFGTSGANYVYDVADAVAGVGTPHVFNLTPGKHKVEIRQRQEQTKLDSLLLTTDPTIDPAGIKPTPRQVKTLGFDLSEMAKIPGAKLTVDVIDYSPNAYMFKNPKVSVPSGTVVVKGLKLLVNGKYLPQNATYTTVDMSVAAPGAVLSSAALIAVKEKGPDQDQFSFSFEKLEKAP